MDSDRELVAAVLTGNRSAYALLVQRYERAVYSVALVGSRDRETARDVAQDAFVQAYEKLATLKDHGAFGAWLLMIARRRAADYLRNRLRLRLRAVGLAATDEVEAPADEDHLALDESMRELLRALQRLPDHERLALSLRYFDGHSVAEVATITGRAVGTVTKQISRALDRLREQLKEKCP